MNKISEISQVETTALGFELPVTDLTILTRAWRHLLALIILIYWCIKSSLKLVLKLSLRFFVLRYMCISFEQVFANFNQSLFRSSDLGHESPMFVGILFADLIIFVDLVGTRTDIWEIIAATLAPWGAARVVSKWGWSLRWGIFRLLF